MVVGVTTQTAPTATAPVAITTNGTSADAQYFTSDVEGLAAKFNENHLELAVKLYGMQEFVIARNQCAHW